jgi:hypothetical protein
MTQLQPLYGLHANLRYHYCDRKRGPAWAKPLDWRIGTLDKKLIMFTTVYIYSNNKKSSRGAVNTYGKTKRHQLCGATLSVSHAWPGTYQQTIGGTTVHFTGYCLECREREGGDGGMGTKSGLPTMAE